MVCEGGELLFCAMHKRGVHGLDDLHPPPRCGIVRHEGDDWQGYEPEHGEHAEDDIKASLGRVCFVRAAMHC